MDGQSDTKQPTSGEHSLWYPEALDRIGMLALLIDRKKWYAAILECLVHSSLRLSELRKALPNTSKKMLIESLRSLEAEGLVTRTDLSGKMRHVRYELVNNSVAEISMALALVRRIRQFKMGRSR